MVLGLISIALLGSIKKMQNMEHHISAMSVLEGQPFATTEASEERTEEEQNLQDIPNMEESEGEAFGGSEADQAEKSTEVIIEHLNAEIEPEPSSEEEETKEIEESKKKDGKEKQTESKESSGSTETQGAVNQFLQQGIYEVQKGENLREISLKVYGTDKYIKQICEQNQLNNPDEIQAGQKLVLPLP